jgi:hypothetical protein
MKESVDSEALVMPSSTSACVAMSLAFGAHAVVGVQQFRTLDLFAHDVVGVTGIGDLHATQHLANDDLDVLVVDLHTLQTVDVLHFVDDVARELFDAQQTQDVLRIGRTVDDGLTLVDHLAFVHQDVLFLGHQIFPDLTFRVW